MMCVLYASVIAQELHKLRNVKTAFFPAFSAFFSPLPWDTQFSPSAECAEFSAHQNDG